MLTMLTLLPVTLSAKVPQIEAKAALLVDAQSGEVLYAKNANGQYPPASTIKLLTALLVWERTRLQGTVDVQAADTKVEPSHIPLRAGERVTVDHLTHALLIGSDNDSAMALARYTGGSVNQFVTLMNARARQLGCTGTIVKNPHGLPIKGQYTTASDMLKIFEAVLAVPTLREICETPRYQLTTKVGSQTIRNHNKLLGTYPGMGPAKTGWTASSRHTYAACAIRNGRELHLIILNSTNKWSDAKLLLNYGFNETKPGPRKATPPPVLVAQAPAQPQTAVVSSGQATAVASVQAAATPTPAPPPAPSSIANTPGADSPPDTSKTDVAAIGPVSAKNQPANSKGLTVYKVKKGDTLYKICRRFDVSMKVVLQHNNLPNPHVINPGLILYIPLQS